MSRDWHGWYEQYDDPTSSLSRRLEVVREQLRTALVSAARPVRLVSMCSGDGRDTLPVLAETGADVATVLVELDPVLADAARVAAHALRLDGVEVRVADAGTTDSYANAGPADVLMACGVFGNITDGHLAATIQTLPTLLAKGALVIWTRGLRAPGDPTEFDRDPSELVRAHFRDNGFDEVELVRPVDAGFRVGVHRWPNTAEPFRPGVRMFDFV